MRLQVSFFCRRPEDFLDQGQGKPNKRILVLKYILEPDAREMGSNQGIMAMAASPSISIAIIGSGGAGALTTVDSLFETAAAAGWQGLFTRTMGPQIRGGGE